MHLPTGAAPSVDSTSGRALTCHRLTSRRPATGGAVSTRTACGRSVRPAGRAWEATLWPPRLQRGHSAARGSPSDICLLFVSPWGWSVLKDYVLCPHHAGAPRSSHAAAKSGRGDYTPQSTTTRHPGRTQRLMQPPFWSSAHPPLRGAHCGDVAQHRRETSAQTAPPWAASAVRYGSQWSGRSLLASLT